MADINIKEVAALRLRMQMIENLMMIGIVGIGYCVYQQKEIQVYYLVGAIVILFALKFYTRIRLRKKEYISNIVEQRTMELRFQRDSMQAESEKLSRALSALAEAQDELVQKEKLASVGQLTQGLVDRILNPLNYINNFATLSVTLSEDIKRNMEEDAKEGNYANQRDSEELLQMLCGNLEKISKHGCTTVRIVKAMEELLKENSANRSTVEVNELCRVNLELVKKTYATEIETRPVIVSLTELSGPLTIEANIEQMGKALQHVLGNSMYAVLKKKEQPGYVPEISLKLRIDGNKLLILVRDNGVGIEDSIKDKVFSPFFTTKTTGEAAGTGLYLSREVVLKHKGTIRLVSEKDTYTEVTILLPIYQ